MALSEVASFAQPLDQFRPGKSQYECVAFGCADIYYCGQPKEQPTGSAADIGNLAEQWYARETGSNDVSNTSGMSTGQEYDMLRGLGLHFQALSGDLLQATKSALADGQPVLICGSESGFFDVGLGRVPYAWSPSGNHCIIASGLASNGDLLVRDYANSEFFGYCRQYAASKMELVSATAVWPRWMENNMIPAGWKDNGTVLTAPSGHSCRTGFRGKVMLGWEASDMPTEEEHGDASMPGGTMQTFQRTILRWNTHDGVTVHALSGDATQVATLQATLKQIATLASAAANTTP